MKVDSGFLFAGCFQFYAGAASLSRIGQPHMDFIDLCGDFR
jgi:hypothetical protein